MKSGPDQAWNNFVLNSEPSAYAKGSRKWAAATANRFMGGANNGGLNSFLTSTWDVDAYDVLAALSAIGADVAAQELDRVLQGLGRLLPASSQDERWDILERYWTEDLDQFDILSDEADAELMEVLTAHVAGDEDFYLGLTVRQPSGQAG